ncbi:N-alpha-acetyltransferase 40-like [Saccoglossus kowalevskii]|uniref:N-alpha-acetyltransferase 40 n=1 Tax=Saccoglossus kowalevskii TaxID=10224 RepID=A0ABM0GWR3_SACKO|nr:PREDICTED: N-alpha-acetyltransferase 40-like [Saccoglossus kowalevskii]
MGRKSAKGKEKKMKRKEESAKLAVSQAKVDAANKLEDPMNSLGIFKKFDRNGMNLTIECKKVTDLEKDTTEWAFGLTKSNMQEFYEASSWGWRDRVKKEELSDDRAWYLVARDSDGLAVAFVHFRFDIDYDDEVLYCYEIQIEKAVRRKGLGKFLMQILGLIALKAEMKKVMLTVFKSNNTANQFFKKVLKYEIDETDQSSLYPLDDYDYEILSKPITLPKKTVSSPGEQNGATAVETAS